MDSVQMEDQTRTLGEAQGYFGLHITDIEVFDMATGVMTPAMVSAWLPSEEERLRIAAGEPIYFLLQGRQHPPCRMFLSEQPQPAPQPRG